MSTIYHLIVGTSEQVPTSDQLAEIVEEFQKPIPVFALPVKVVPLHHGLDGSRIMVSVQSITWSPTDTEVEELRKLFANVSADANGGIVATRVGVKAQVIAGYQPVLTTEAQ